MTGPRKHYRLYAILSLAIIALIVIAATRFNIKRHFEGVYILKAGKGALIELTDDIYLGDGSRLIWGMDLDYPVFHVGETKEELTKGPHLYYEWDSGEGGGYVRNFLPGGKELVTCFSRFDDVDKQEHGLFVGGGLPASVRVDSALKLNETGMAYFDGKTWHHVWCSVNEGLASCISAQKVPSFKWKFLGSKVLQSTSRSLSIRSSHEVVMDGVPLGIDRYAYFNAGETFFVLSVIIKNTGKSPVSYYYCYGDEPWVGSYGTSAGNVGWVKDRVMDYVGWVDTSKYDFAGMYDCGNDAIGEGHDFSMTADFIEWLGNNRPEQAYFSNAPNDFPKEGMKEPLSSNQRYIGIQWGPRILRPGQTERYSMAIGMAGHDPKTGFPVKPDINLKNTP